MTNLSNLAIVGSGPTAIYLLKYICDSIDIFRDQIEKVTVFEKEEVLGMGMPYHPKTTDIYNLANISSEEIPMLQESFADWLRKQPQSELQKFNTYETAIDDSEVYSRIALGHYFAEQFQQLISCLESYGIKVIQQLKCEVFDISQEKESSLIITDCNHKSHQFSTVIVANGHEWKEIDKPECGYYASPWPIHKLIPADDQTYNFPIGTLGASLSAFDVVTSLSHRHGVFAKVGKKLTYIKKESNPDFKIVLHSSAGWLPHLQYEQLKPIREIYRHFDRDELLNLINDQGFLCIENYFDTLCRPALLKAFGRDKLYEVVEKLQKPNFSFKDLVKLMSEKHKYVDSFEGMKLEMTVAKNSVYNKIPIYWMETLDDLMYSLNYHAELLSAEDHLFFHKEITSFLMNVIAALPLQSAEILLALYDADCIELISGKVTFPKDAFENGSTKIVVEKPDGSRQDIEYQLFVNCSGSTKLEIKDYRFKSLVDQGVVRSATAPFSEPETLDKYAKQIREGEILETSDNILLKLSGIDIDSSYRTINKNGTPNNFLFDINFNHTNGLRPYSYGLQACSATSLILVESLLLEILDGKNVSADIEDITKLYETNDEL
ncbi:FAD/NAD(P)-binding protein [Flavobacterium ardleyense]|uniref:FAD/NAD(P)-binding protein n=1 Tax=Flavobacterium ardleyense TaxID=2038737 RepID=UPI00298D4795|nr:FAD/NAD(P)-binding protein [Flavobacterium ardleyense]